jgi:hypothetical protein
MIDVAIDETKSLLDGEDYHALPRSGRSQEQDKGSSRESFIGEGPLQHRRKKEWKEEIFTSSLP